MNFDLPGMNNIDHDKYFSGNPARHQLQTTVTELLQKEIELIICTVADKRSIPALINLLDDKEFNVRWIAAEGLIRIGRKSIVPLLLELRDGRNFMYPRKAHHVLQSLLTKSEKRALQPLLSTLTGNNGHGSRTDYEASYALKRIFRYLN